MKAVTISLNFHTHSLCFKYSCKPASDISSLYLEKEWLEKLKKDRMCRKFIEEMNHNCRFP